MKKLLAMALALVMALGVTTMAWAEGEGPDMSGTVVNVTAANAQDVLDGKYGDIDGKTINFTESIDSVLVLARPTKYEGSKTVWYNGAWTQGAGWTRVDTPVTEVNGLTENVRYYVRTVSNVTFTANSGVTVKGVYSHSGIVNGSGQYDYVVERAVSGGDLYYGTSSLKNISFEGITFTAQCNIESSLAESVLDGVTFTNCTFNINNTASGNQAIRFYSEEPTGKVKNLVVDGCTFNSCFQGVYAQDVANVTVTGCTFNATGHNAIAVQGDSSGTIVIEENYINGAGDRAIRFGNIGAESTITVNNNIMVNSGDDSDQLFKAENINGATIDLENNYWNGKDAATAVSNNGGVTVPTKTGITGGTFKGEVTADMLAEGMEAVKNDDGSYTVGEKTPEQPPRYYYNSTTTTDTKKDDGKSSPKTFDAGVGVYAVSAILSVTGMAYVGKKF